MKKGKINMNFGLALQYNRTRNIVRLAQQSEEHGWDGLFLGDAIWCEDPMIGLSAAAVVTNRIRLGILVIPVPLRRPWKIASESVALDHLSDGRLILGLGTGAVWMGWQGFPDEVTDNKARSEMLNETIDILTLLYQGRQFDYEGNRYHLKLTLLDDMYYPPKPVQRPRVPIWTPAIWPRENSIQRALNCDGMIVEKRSPGGREEEITPKDVREINKFILENQSHTKPYDIVVIGSTYEMDFSRRKEKITQFEEAGATWWIEGLWDGSPEVVTDCIRQGPPIVN